MIQFRSDQRLQRWLCWLGLSLVLTSCADRDVPLGPRYVRAVHDSDGTEAPQAPGSVPGTTTPGFEAVSDASSAPTDATHAGQSVEHAIVVSIDGLAVRYLEQLLESGAAPGFAHLQSLSAWTHNARTDKSFTNTLPNHTCMLTGLPVSPIPGYRRERAHGYVNNGDPSPSDTLHNTGNPARSYTPSIFDVAHDHGMSTGLFASKSKFVIYEQSYNGWGAPDVTGTDDGTRKIDFYVENADPTTLVDSFIGVLNTSRPRLSFVHLSQPDLTGHAYGWGSEPYFAAVTLMDQQLGKLIATVTGGAFAGKTALVVTTDHGGVDNSHLDAEDARNYTIPFYLLAPGIRTGDAYAVFANRYDPGEINPGYEAAEQPLRNGDSGNLALALLGLPPVPGSFIHSAGLLRN